MKKHKYMTFIENYCYLSTCDKNGDIQIKRYSSKSCLIDEHVKKLERRLATRYVRLYNYLFAK